MIVEGDDDEDGEAPPPEEGPGVPNHKKAGECGEPPMRA